MQTHIRKRHSAIRRILDEPSKKQLIRQSRADTRPKADQAIARVGTSGVQFDINAPFTLQTAEAIAIASQKGTATKAPNRSSTGVNQETCRQIRTTKTCGHIISHRFSILTTILRSCRNSRCTTRYLCLVTLLRNLMPIYSLGGRHAAYIRSE